MSSTGFGLEIGHGPSGLDTTGTRVPQAAVKLGIPSGFPENPGKIWGKYGENMGNIWGKHGGVGVGGILRR